MPKIKRMGGSPGPGISNLPLQIWDTLNGDRQPAADSETHLLATMQWLCRAQDAGEDDGVARMYHLRSGWGASYPETTGYIIPTFLDYARHKGDATYAERALRMAAWESEVQLETGAVRGGTIADPPSPAIFNTGQVLFGWCAAFRHSGDERFRSSALAAADYLCAQQDEDGAWRRNLSNFCDAPSESYAYNIRSAWALLLAHRTFGMPAHQEAGRRNMGFVQGLARDNGWIADNCLNRPREPLLHTIAYTFQGLLECAQLEDDAEVLELVLTGNRYLREKHQEYGTLLGRYADCWTPTVRWRCLTGEAQTAIVWWRLGDITGDTSWHAAASEVIRQIKTTQRLTGAPEIVGGVKGSQPVTAPYGRLEYLSWAAKFFADALMLEVGVPGAAQSG